MISTNSKLKLKKYLFLFFSIINLVLLTEQNSYAQKIRVNNLEKYDKQQYHFGFLLGVNSTNFKLKRAGDFYKLDTVLVVEPQRQSGFNLGIVTDLKLSEHFNLRFIPELAFSQRDLHYYLRYGNQNSSLVVKKVESTFLNFPIELKFKSSRVGNYRMYVLGGFRYSIDMVSQAKVNASKEVLVKLRKNDYGYVVGFGIDCYLELFKFAPEFKMFQGIPNVLAPSSEQFTTSINSLKSRVFSVSLTFE